MLKVEGLRKLVAGAAESFTLQADFHVASGERAALLGKSGSGKTTLLRLLAGLEAIDAGRAWLDEREITRLDPRERQIGYVVQDAGLFPSLSVLENVTFGLRMRGVPAAERRREGTAWLERVGLAARARDSVQILSGGERQRVAFARAVIWKPRALLLDEPFSALDAELRASLREELVRLHALVPVPLILVTHDEADVAAVANVRLRLEVDGDRRSVRRD